MFTGIHRCEELYLSISMATFFILHYISEGNYFALPLAFNSCSYFTDQQFQ